MPSFGDSLAKTRRSLLGRIAGLLGATEIDSETWDDLEALLIQADLGVETTQYLIEKLRDRVRREGITRERDLRAFLREELLGILLQRQPRLNLHGRPISVLLIVGVNGSGKTTAIGKLAHKYRKVGRSVLLVAADTFRAAAIEQLREWADRAGVDVISGQPGGDPGAVVFDALQAARNRGYNLVIVDTAGRLHTKYNLMAELGKIGRVMKKVIPDAPHETLLVLDATTGQNALVQARKFQEAVNVTGVILTKLDSSAKGGMIFAVYRELGLPVHFVGIGEGLDDLAPFDPVEFVDALFEEP